MDQVSVWIYSNRSPDVCEKTQRLRLGLLDCELLLFEGV